MIDQSLAEQQAAGLRALADMLEQNPELAKHAAYLDSANVFFVDNAEDHAAIARAARQHGAQVTKQPSESLYNLRLSWGPMAAMVLASRGDVCERVVTGTRTVTQKVPDPELLAEVPEVEVTAEVEDFEWVCRPLLSVDPAEAVAS